MRTAVFLAVLSMLLISTAALAGVPGQINYQGTLMDAYGVALDTTVSMMFSICADSTGSIPLWTETQSSVEVTAGLFNVLLGSVTPITESDFPGPPVWLKVQVGGDPALSPLQKLVSVGYAFHAAEADTASYALSAPAAADGDWIISGSDMYAGVSGKVGIGTSTPVFSLDIQDSYPFVRTQATAGNAGLVIDKYRAIDHGHVVYRTGGEDRWTIGLTGDDNYRIRYWPTTTDVMYLQSTGEVGIGTTSPAAKLDCPGPVRIGSPVSAPGSAVGLMLFANDNTFNSIPLAILNTDTDHLFYVRGNGDVGVGTFNPAAKLDVVGTAKMTGLTLPTGAGSGKVLTSDASGNGTWQAGFTGLWTDAGSDIYANTTPKFTLFDDNSIYVGLSYINQVETDAVTNWYNDGSNVLHCYNFGGSDLYGMRAIVYSDLTDFGVASSGQEWGGYFQCGTGGTAVYGQYDADTYGYLGTTSFGAYGQYQTGVYGILGGPTYGVYGQNTSYSYGKIGYSQTKANYFYHRELEVDGDGQSAAYAYRYRDSQNDGTGYGTNTSNNALSAYNYYGDLYTFGAAGHNWNDFTRCGGTLGARYDGSYWGSMGYKNSGSSTYGGYFTSYTSGTGKGDQAALGIGLGAWGDLFGADIHGQVYGAYLEGGHYASYSNGDVFKNGMDVHLQETEEPSMAVLYTNVSTDVTVQTSGFASLSGGKSTISFDKHFRSVVSPEVPVVVTVTPIGDCNGIHVSKVTRDGFTVVENNAGKSSVQVAFIAIGRRAGYENPQLPADVVSADYVNKLSRGLHNDADTQSDGEGLFFKDGELVVGVHPSTLPDPNKPAEELKQSEQVPPPDVLPVGPAEVRMERPSQDNRASEQIRTKQSD